MFILIMAIIVVIVLYALQKQKPNKSKNNEIVRGQVDRSSGGINKTTNSKLSPSMYWSLAEKHHMPQYTIGWLNYSLELGRDIDTAFYYAVQSAENGMPYLCESEEEYEWLEDYLKSKRTAVDIMLIGSRYLGEPTANNIAHPYKLEYWRDQYMELVYRRGDQKARELLTRRPDGIDVSSGFFSDNMWI